MQHEKTIQYLDGRAPKKVIVVVKRIVNIVGLIFSQFRLATLDF